MHSRSIREKVPFGMPALHTGPAKHGVLGEQRRTFLIQRKPKVCCNLPLMGRNLSNKMQNLFPPRDPADLERAACEQEMPSPRCVDTADNQVLGLLLLLFSAITHRLKFGFRGIWLGMST